VLDAFRCAGVERGPSWWPVRCASVRLPERTGVGGGVLKYCSVVQECPRNVCEGCTSPTEQDFRTRAPRSYPPAADQNHPPRPTKATRPGRPKPPAPGAPADQSHLPRPTKATCPGRPKPPAPAAPAAQSHPRPIKATRGRPPKATRPAPTHPGAPTQQRPLTNAS